MPMDTPVATAALPRALIDGASPESLPALSVMLGHRHYQFDFLEPHETPYDAIRRRQPDLAVLYFAPDNGEACRVLAMLQLDPATRKVAVLTCIAGEAYVIIPSEWPRTSGTSNVSNSLAPCTAR